MCTLHLPSLTRLFRATGAGQRGPKPEQGRNPSFTNCLELFWSAWKLAPGRQFFFNCTVSATTPHPPGVWLNLGFSTLPACLPACGGPVDPVTAMSPTTWRQHPPIIPFLLPCLTLVWLPPLPPLALLIPSTELSH